ncbi:hypothetical protein K440DRAFT_594945 [Wilcoxina mikolae CBS 423.85]|nr:hypothetical protein K440DRAFT_594945 [Wilcoxina mikolae CBS 423.85]
MSSSASSDEVVIARVVAHMNNDHLDAIHDYAQYFARLPAPLASTATLSTLSLSKLTLTVTSAHGAQSTVNIPLNPPMKSFSESRERLVAMTIEAMEGLGRSRYKVQRWVPPGFVGSIVCAAVAFGYWSFWNGDVQFAKGGFVRETLFRGEMLGQVADLLRKWSYHLFWLVIAVHSLEVVLIHKTRLGKHGVETGSALWWKWALQTFAEGVGSVKRFDGEVRRLKREEEEKGGKKH